MKLVFEYSKIQLKISSILNDAAHILIKDHYGRQIKSSQNFPDGF